MFHPMIYMWCLETLKYIMDSNNASYKFAIPFQLDGLEETRPVVDSDLVRGFLLMHLNLLARTEHSRIIFFVSWDWLGLMAEEPWAEGVEKEVVEIAL